MRWVLVVIFVTVYQFEARHMCDYCVAQRHKLWKLRASGNSSALLLCSICSTKPSLATVLAPYSTQKWDKTCALKSYTRLNGSERAAELVLAASTLPASLPQVTVEALLRTHKICNNKSFGCWSDKLSENNTENCQYFGMFHRLKQWIHPENWKKKKPT